MNLRNCLVVCLVSLVGTSAAHASLGGQNIPNVFGYETGQSRIWIDGTYTLTETREVLPRKFGVSNAEQENEDFTTATIRAGQPFHIAVHGTEVTITPAVDSQYVGSVPNSFIFETEDLEDLPFQLVKEGDLESFYSIYAMYDEVDVAGNCKRLTEAHLGFYVSGDCASQVTAGKLAKVGFHSISCDSSKAELQIWGGGHKQGNIAKCGHMAYKHGTWTDKQGKKHNAWSSGDYSKNHGNPGKKYYSKGCFTRK